MAMAAGVGVRRQIEAFRAGRQDQHGATSAEVGGRGRGWHLHIEGAAGEMAVAKALNRHWSASVNTFKVGGDVGRVQVRTRSRHDYELIVRPEERDTDAFILVTGIAPAFRVHGWCYGREAKREEWRQNHGGHGAAFFVPASALRTIAVASS